MSYLSRRKGEILNHWLCLWNITIVTNTEVGLHAQLGQQWGILELLPYMHCSELGVIDISNKFIQF